MSREGPGLPFRPPPHTWKAATSPPVTLSTLTDAAPPSMATSVPAGAGIEASREVAVELAMARTAPGKACTWHWWGAPPREQQHQGQSSSGIIIFPCAHAAPTLVPWGAGECWPKSRGDACGDTSHLPHMHAVIPPRPYIRDQDRTFRRPQHIQRAAASACAPWRRAVGTTNIMGGCRFRRRPAANHHCCWFGGRLGGERHWRLSVAAADLI